MKIPHNLTREDRDWIRPHAELAGEPLMPEPLPYMGKPPHEDRPYVDESTIIEGWVCRHYLDTEGGSKGR